MPLPTLKYETDFESPERLNKPFKITDRLPAALHPNRLEHPLERELREEIIRMFHSNPGLAIAHAPMVKRLVSPGHGRVSPVTGGWIPEPYGPMTRRDFIMIVETIQWLGSNVGFNMLGRAIRKAGGQLEFDDYKKSHVQSTDTAGEDTSNRPPVPGG